VRIDVEPVARIGRGGGHGPPQAGQPGGVHHRDPRGHHGQHHEQGREQPPGPPEPEVAQVQPARPGPLAEQQVGDEVTAEREEDAHAQQAPGRPAELLVIGDDSEHRQRAQPIESGHIALAGADWFRHAFPPVPRTALSGSPRPARSCLRAAGKALPSASCRLHLVVTRVCPSPATGDALCPGIGAHIPGMAAVRTHRPRPGGRGAGHRTGPASGPGGQRAGWSADDAGGAVAGPGWAKGARSGPAGRGVDRV